MGDGDGVLENVEDWLEAPEHQPWSAEVNGGYEHHDRHDGHHSSSHHVTHVTHHQPHQPHHGGGAHDLLRTQVRTHYGRGISVGDLLGWLDHRVTELHAALLEDGRHPSRVAGSPVRMSGLDALLNTDATAFRTLTELGARLERVEDKLDRLLERLPER